MTLTININFHSNILPMFHMNLALIGQTDSEKKIYECYGDIGTCIMPRCVGRPAPGIHFFHNHKLSVHLHISIKIFPSNEILTIFKCMHDLC